MANPLKEHSFPEATQTGEFSSPPSSPLPSVSASLSPSAKRPPWSRSSISSYKSKLHLRSPRTLSSENASLDGSSILEKSADDEPELPASISPGSLAERGIDQSPRPELKQKNKWSFRGRKQERSPDQSQEPKSRILALEGESIASRHNIGNASVEGEFHKIEYGRYEGRPACLVIVDLSLVYNPGNIISKMRIEFQFGKADAEQTSSANDFDQRTRQMIKSPISKKFMPHDIKGIGECMKITKHSDIKPVLQGLSFKVGAGGGGSHITTAKEHRWHVQGRTEQHDGIYDTFGWNVFENSMSEDSVPRKLRLGMIVFQQHQSFWVNVTIDGDIRKKLKSPKTTQGKEVVRSSELQRH